MSEYSTGSPSMEQTRWYLIRPPSAACTWWNLTSWSSVAEYSFTPMLTRPNDTAPRQIDRMLLPLPDDPTTGSRSPGWGPRRVTGSRAAAPPPPDGGHPCGGRDAGCPRKSSPLDARRVVLRLPAGERAVLDA